MEDERFAHVLKDPKFRRIPKHQKKVKIDKRFQSMFKDQKFKVKYTVDKRGRPVNYTSTEDLKRYYEISSEEESSDSDANDDRENHASSNQKTNKSDGASVTDDSNELKRTDKSDKVISEVTRQKLKNLNVDYARGEARLFSESSSDDESEDELSEVDEIDHKWGELDADAGETEEATYRLAVCNMDWDRIRATDLMVLFNSFLPPGGAIKSVAIYPSEFGKKRLADEEIKGPVELVESKLEDNESENEEGSSYHKEKLRQYQLNRLKYYYAVVTFDSPESANKIYTDCDGVEYESSGTKIDLRFIPDDMRFDDAPKEMCDKLLDVNKYQPRFFTTTALQQIKVDLTWDETDPQRLEMMEKLRNSKIDEISDADLRNYLASGSEEEDNEAEDGNVINKYKALLQEIEEDEKKDNRKHVEMEVSWGDLDSEEKTEKYIKDKIVTSQDESLLSNDNSADCNPNKSQKQEETKRKIEKQKNKVDSEHLLNENDDSSIEKYKALLQEVEGKESDEKDMEMSWDINLKEKTEKLVKNQKDKNLGKTPFEEYLEKKREKRKEKRAERKKNLSKNSEDSDTDIPSDIDMSNPYFAEEFNNSDFKKKKKRATKRTSDDDDGEKQAELELLLMNETDNKEHFSLKKIQERETETKRKGKKKKSKKIVNNAEKTEDNFEINANDDRFSAIYTSHHFNIDPTDSHYKKTKGMEVLVNEKLKRRHGDNVETNTKKPKTDSKKKAELSSLIKSVKRNVNNFRNT